MYSSKNMKMASEDFKKPALHLKMEKLIMANTLTMNQTLISNAFDL